MEKNIEDVVQTGIRLERKHLDIIKQESKKKGRSVNSLLRVLIRDYCENIKKESSLD